MGILKSLFVLVFILFTLGNLIRISITPQAYVYPVDVGIFLFVSYGLYLSLTKNKKVNWLYPFHFLVLIMIVSLLINVYWLSMREFFVSSLYILRFVLYTLMIPVISINFNKKQVRWLLTIVISSLMVTVVGGLVQYFLYSDLRNLSYLGWDVHLYRVFSSFLDPNFASVIFVLLFWLLVLSISHVKNNKYLLYISSVSLMATLVAILLTYSRTGYIALIGSLIIYLISTKNVKLFVGIFIIFVVGIIVVPKNLTSEGVNLLRTASIESRLNAYDTAIQLWQKNPVVGVGFNTYRYAQENFSVSFVTDTSHAGAGTANSYLFILATTGVLGLLCFVYVIREIIMIINKRLNGHVRSIAFALCGVVLISSFTENVLFYSFILIVVLSLLGILKIVSMEKTVQ